MFAAQFILLVTPGSECVDLIHAPVEVPDTAMTGTVMYRRNPNHQVRRRLKRVPRCMAEQVVANESHAAWLSR